jgi:hypothetical protein
MASFSKMNAILFGSCEGVEVWTIVFNNISQCISNSFWKFDSSHIYIQFGDVAKLDNHPHEDLAKFEYILDMKIEKKLRMILYFGYLLEHVVEIW